MSENGRDSPEELDDSLNGEFPSQKSDSDGLDSSNESEALKKKRRLEQSPRPSPVPAFMVAASPPKFVSFDQLMAAASGVANMSLAHEIAVDSNFKFEKLEPEENSIEKQVKEVMHKAFWDALQEKLNEDPPDMSHAMVLLGEVKENLLGILLPQHERLRTHINEILDMDLIQQKVDNDALDFTYYAEFVISIMARLCAPVRDETIAKLREIRDIVPLYREIFATLDLMKMDMANFQIQQIRPYLQKQSVEYEKKKFQDFLTAQEESGVDGLQFTRIWLSRSAAKLEKLAQEVSSEASVSTVTPAKIMNDAYMELLSWDDNEIFPETLLMDQSRYLDLRNQTQRVTLISAILLVTYNTAGAPIAGIKDFKEKLKKEIEIILNDVPDSDVPKHIENVADHLNKSVGECMIQHGFSMMSESQQTMLKGQVRDVVSKEHPVHKIIRSRVFDFIHQTMVSAHSSPLKIPPGLSAVQRELSQICGQFLRLIAHNRAVFGVWYADIISTLLKLKKDISPSGSTSDAPGN